MENSRRGDMYGMVMLGLQVETLAMAAVTTHAPAASFVAAAAYVGPCGPGGAMADTRKWARFGRACLVMQRILFVPFAVES